MAGQAGRTENLPGNEKTTVDDMNGALVQDNGDTTPGAGTNAEEDSLGTISMSIEQSQSEAPLTNRQRRHAKRDAKTNAPQADERPRKQRRELDVYNRILWDQDYDPASIIIGYLDRHSDQGIIEIDFESWERESTADEFVPLHRIKYFRRRGENTFLWHRAFGIDRVFGSD